MARTGYGPLSLNRCDFAFFFDPYVHGFVSLGPGHGPTVLDGQLKAIGGRETQFDRIGRESVWGLIPINPRGRHFGEHGQDAFAEFRRGSLGGTRLPGKKEITIELGIIFEFVLAANRLERVVENLR